MRHLDKKKIQPKIHERVHMNEKDEDLDEKTNNLRKSLGLPPLKSSKVNQKDCESVHEDENLSKGQLISECLLNNLKFSKNHQKI